MMLACEVYMHKDNDMMAEWRQEREIYKAIIEEYEEEVLELERKLKCKKEALQILVGEKSKNIQQRKMLEDKLESQDPKLYDVEGYKLEDRFKIETWYFLTKEEAKLHIRFEKYLESCSFITHNSAPAKVISMLENKPELQEFKSLPTALIKTGVQRRINRLKRLKEHEITIKFFRDMIANDYIEKYRGCSPEDLRSHLKDENKFSYLNDLDYVTFCHESQRVLGLFPDSFTGDIKHMIRRTVQSLNTNFDLRYRQFLMSCEIVEKDVVYYDAFEELEKEFGKYWFGDSEGVSSHNLSAAGLKSCDKQVGMSKMAIMNGLGGVDMRNQKEMIKEGKDIEEPGDLDQWFGSHKWRIKGYRVSQLTAAVTFQTKHGEKLKKLPKSGFVRRALNTHKTKRQRLQSHIDIIERDIVKQLQCALLQPSAVDSTDDDDYDDNMSENEPERTGSCADDHNTIKNDDHGDANPEACLQQLICFDKYLDEHVLIKRDSSAKEIFAKLVSNQKVLIPKDLATFHIQRKIDVPADMHLLDQYNIFLQNLVDYFPYITLHEEVDEAYKRLESDNKLYDLPDHRVTIGLKNFQNILLNLETPYEPGLREAHRADLLYIINTKCKIQRRSRMKFWKLNDVGDHVYKEFLKSLIMRDYAEIYDKATWMIPLHRMFDSHLASSSFVKFDSSPEELIEDKRLILEEYSILPRNLIEQSINFRLLILKKQHELRRCAELVKYLLYEYAECFDVEQVLRECGEFSDLPKHIILRGIRIWKKTLECKDTPNIKARLSLAHTTCAAMNCGIMNSWEKTRYYEDQIYEVPLVLAEKVDMDVCNLEVPIADIFFHKPLPKNGVKATSLPYDAGCNSNHAAIFSQPRVGEQGDRLGPPKSGLFFSSNWQQRKNGSLVSSTSGRRSHCRTPISLPALATLSRSCSLHNHRTPRSLALHHHHRTPLAPCPPPDSTGNSLSPIPESKGSSPSTFVRYHQQHLQHRVPQK